MKSKLIWQIYPAFLIMVLLAILLTGIFSTQFIKQFLYDRTKNYLSETAMILLDLFPGDISLRPGSAQEFCSTTGRNTTIRITIIQPDGTVIGDSHENPASMDNHNNRVEVIEAYQKGTGSSIRFSKTLSRDMVYVAFSAGIYTDFPGILRVSMAVEDVNEVLSSVFRRIFITSLVILAFTAVISIFIARNVSKPLATLKQAAEQYARGDFEYPLYVDNPEEAKTLATTMTGMAQQLKLRLSMITSQKNELEAMLSGMIEAVIVLNHELKIVKLNPAAVKLIQPETPDYMNKPLIEVFRNSELNDFAYSALSAESPLETTIHFYRLANSMETKDSIIYLQAHGTKLPEMGEGGEYSDRGGILLVMHDITRMKHLETIRKDFVANVSHELKTPITSIKGFVETLKEGAKDQPDKAERFLDIIGRHSDRLNNIIDDLLSLSSLEQYRAEEIEREPADINTIINRALAACSSKAAQKNISVINKCAGENMININPLLIEQALVNLIDNALKYSDEAKAVTVSCRSDETNIYITVRDEGCGISSKELPRIFERFYRVDKARSREQGGTGLGLAIVKHIAVAHHGDVTAESTLGIGSEFTLRLPR